MVVLLNPNSSPNTGLLVQPITKVIEDNQSTTKMVIEAMSDILGNVVLEMYFCFHKICWGKNTKSTF